jgi:streptomycin 6-kinase
MNLPPEFISTITNTFGEDGEQLLANLPALIEEASQRWGLTNVKPVPALSYNFVAFALRLRWPGLDTGEKTTRLTRPTLAPLSEQVVLKIGVPRDELISEIAALRLFNGEGACQLLEADEEKGFLLLERLQPGVMLATLEDDEEATHIAAEVMKRIWRPVDSASFLSDSQEQVSPRRHVEDPATGGGDAPALQSFILLSDWFDGLNELRAMFDGGTGPLDERLVERTEAAVKDFLSENHMPVLMHGDFHHYNILSSERGWLVIDPKGVIGPAGYEVGPLLTNPWESLKDRISNRLILRRVDILHEHLGWERERILEWSLAHAVLSAWWGIEDNTGWDYALNFARLLEKLK